jgi:hypothetical protein
VEQLRCGAQYRKRKAQAMEDARAAAILSTLNYITRKQERRKMINIRDKPMKAKQEENRLLYGTDLPDPPLDFIDIGDRAAEAAGVSFDRAIYYSLSFEEKAFVRDMLYYNHSIYSHHPKTERVRSMLANGFSLFDNCFHLSPVLEDYSLKRSI